ncbi:hypothetical protein ElyMa_005469300 [Elysia marginata]|uniref:Reverse transcriptase domain-containing protein n=1 Tax=Elysia marginata TaxID=1093978 RepID=A0AAV4EP40_9GAST|nr:hypothetical protein ElyMa_005469300 [Elysia marginata]
MNCDPDPDLDQGPDLEKVTFDFWTKNISIHGKEVYIKSLIHRTETFVKNLRWRAFFFLNPELVQPDKETFGFNSTRPPPFIPELKDFKNELAELIQNIKFKKTYNSFQAHLNRDIKSINNEKRLFIPADKTNNFYKIKPQDYEKLLSKSIQQEYSKSDTRTTDEITRIDKHIASTLSLADRINVTAKREAFITLKDHKENFKNKPTCRLINPCKPEIGKISKQILERINKDVREKTQSNQRRKTKDVITWFDNIKDKKEKSFIIFDICDFYPSISEKLLDEALDFASTHSNFTAEERFIIKHTKKTTLYNNNTPWSKKKTNFDVTMGSYDGAETCELVGLFLLSQLNKLNIDVGLYRDDGLAVCKKAQTPKQIKEIKQTICKIFKNN